MVHRAAAMALFGSILGVDVFHGNPFFEGFIFDVVLKLTERQRIHPSVQFFTPLLLFEPVSDVREIFQGDDRLFELFCICHDLAGECMQ